MWSSAFLSHAGLNLALRFVYSWCWLVNEHLDRQCAEKSAPFHVLSQHALVPSDQCLRERTVSFLMQGSCHVVLEVKIFCILPLIHIATFFIGRVGCQTVSQDVLSSLEKEVLPDTSKIYGRLMKCNEFARSYLRASPDEATEYC